MTNRKSLCLNMIVKNEMANLERCLSSVVDHIACWVIGDTGSSDGTQDFIMSFFAAHGVSGELHNFPFENFEQARNAALDYAQASPLAYDYLLFADADMELVVEDAEWRAKLEEPGYRLIQRTSSGLTYWNTRLARRDVGARYYGVTHEYIDVPGGVEGLNGAWYKDHATGANRTDKFDRDIKLLLRGLEKEPDNARYWFYLAQSYRDAGKDKEAVETYAKRAAMAGWEEEAWYAELQQARCLRNLGEEGGFLRQALAAFNRRPGRAEPLYDLARYYRGRSMHETSLVFSEFGLSLPRPTEDVLFIEDFVYTAGLQEEYSIAANYARDPVRKDRGHAACNWLALNRTIPEGTRAQARSNLFFYLEPAAAMMPSFEARGIGFTAPEGFRPMNPSIANWGGRLVMVQRTVNYTLAEDGRYEAPGNASLTRNFLLDLDHALEIRSAAEILPPVDMPESRYPVRGFEDMRLFAWKGALWCSATVRELNPEGWCDQVLARIDESDRTRCRLTDWRALRPPGPRLHEKNWMPLVVPGDELRFVYLCDPTRIVDDQAQDISLSIPPIAAETFSGGSQAISFDGGWLALIHELGGDASTGRRYQHRFVWFDAQHALRGVSRAFFFNQKGIEYAAGLAWHPDGERLLVSYGVGDRESWIAAVAAHDVRKVLLEAPQLPSARPEPSAGFAAPGAMGVGEGLPTAQVRSERPQDKTGEAAAGEEGSLASIFDRWGTDKAANGYAELYECLFRKDRHRIEAVLEIGIGTMIPGVSSSMVGFGSPGYKPGASLRSWRDFFPNATIYGFDVQPDTQFGDEQRIVTAICDSTDRSQVDRAMQAVGGRHFDIVLDDGSHRLEDQLATLRNLYRYVKEGGTYIVEDVVGGALIHHRDEISAICDGDPFFFHGEGNNPLVIVKRPRTVVASARNTTAGEAEMPEEMQHRDAEAETDWGASLRGTANTLEDKFLDIAPFLRAADSPEARRRLSRGFDARIAQFLGDTAGLPQINCFYQVLSDTAAHHGLRAATASMRAAGHPVQVWSYSPEKLEFLRSNGVDVRQADDVVPRGLFERIVAGSEIRYFSDIFRYALLYEHGGLWMDTDVVMLRPFPFRGDYFLNLQWRGAHKGHFICGNVMYAEPYSRHLRNLYEMSIERFFASRGTDFGEIGPKLLSEYVMSSRGAELQQRLFSPMLFNPIDWTEHDKFTRPIGELTEYLNDERIFGVHLWNGKTNAQSRDEGMSLISLLSDLPSLTDLADRFDTDKNRRAGNRHCYARIYDRLLSSRRFSLRRVLEVGFSKVGRQGVPSADLWQAYFPFAHVTHLDLIDNSRFDAERFSSIVCDQSKLEDLRSATSRLQSGSLDVIIEDGSHASRDQQMTFRELFPMLAEGGWYFIENLDWQPPGENHDKIVTTKQLFGEIQRQGRAQSHDPFGISDLSGQVEDILFFDSHYELQRANLLGGLLAVKKRGSSRFVR